MFSHLGRHQELCVCRPAVGTFGEPDLLFPERLAVSGAGVLLVRRPVCDVAVDDDERWAVVSLFEDRKRAIEHIEVVGIAYVRDIPAVRPKPRRNVFGECQGGRAFDRDLVVVVDPAEVR